VWRVLDVKVAGTDASATPAQPGLYLFTARHYSIMRVSADAPRPELPMDVTKATAEQLIASWNPFTANAGTYEVNGPELMTHPQVAKVPQVMAPNAFAAYRWAIAGDTLTITPLRNQMGATPRPATLRLLRVE
jgi:hypothetical protein